MMSLETLRRLSERLSRFAERFMELVAAICLIGLLVSLITGVLMIFSSR